MRHKLKLALVAIFAFACAAVAIATPYLTGEQVLNQWAANNYTVNASATPPTYVGYLNGDQILNQWMSAGFPVTVTGSGTVSAGNLVLSGDASVGNLTITGTGIYTSSSLAFVIPGEGQIYQMTISNNGIYQASMLTVGPINYSSSSTFTVMDTTNHHGFLWINGNLGTYGCCRIDGTSISMITPLGSGNYTVTASPSANNYGLTISGSLLKMVMGSSSADEISLSFQGT